MPLFYFFKEGGSYVFTKKEDKIIKAKKEVVLKFFVILQKAFFNLMEDFK